MLLSNAAISIPQINIDTLSELAINNSTPSSQNPSARENLVRRGYQDTPLNPNKQLVVIGDPVKPINVTGTKLWVHDPKECLISKALLEEGKWEPYMQRALMEELPPKKDDGIQTQFLDIGGNIGAFSIIMAAAGYAVETIEPMEYNVELLYRSIIENHFEDRVKLFKLAAGETYVPKVCLDVFMSSERKPNIGNNRISVNAKDTGNNCVPQVRLDSIVSRCPDLVKVDVEGYEVNALKGLGVTKYHSCRPTAIAIEALGYGCRKIAGFDHICTFGY
jgi:FkbM family methyltransferase